MKISTKKKLINFKNVESPNNINLLKQRLILDHRITQIYLSCNSMNQLILTKPRQILY